LSAGPSTFSSRLKRDRKQSSYYNDGSTFALFQHVSVIPHFKEFPPHLIEWVEFGVQSTTPPNKPQGPVLPPHMEAIVKGAAPPAVPATSVVSVPPPAVAKPTAPPASTGSK
jgi:hypothetical protein